MKINKNFNINNTNLPSIKNQLSSRRIIESVPESTKEHVVHFNNSKEHPLSNKMKLMKKMSKMSKISRQSQATFADEDNLFYDNKKC